MSVYSETLLYQVETALPKRWTNRVHLARANITDSNSWHRDSQGFAIQSLPAAAGQPWLVTSLMGRDIMFTSSATRLPPTTHHLPRRRSLQTQETNEPFIEEEKIYRFMSGVFSSNDGHPSRSARSYPSAGGLYPVQVLVAHRCSRDTDQWRTTHYIPSINSIEELASFTNAAMLRYIGRTEVLDPCAAGFLIAYLIIPTLAIAKYGPRGYKFSLLEVGAMQEAARRSGEMIGLASRPYGYYDELGIAALFGLNPDRVWVEGLQFFGYEAASD